MAFLVVFACVSVADYIPDTISVQQGEAVELGSFLPVTQTVKVQSSEDKMVSSNANLAESGTIENSLNTGESDGNLQNEMKISENHLGNAGSDIEESDSAVSGKKESGSLSWNSETIESFGIFGSTDETYEMEVRLLGIIPVKDVTVHIVEETQVIPCGVPIGIYVHTQGILVVDTGEVETADGQTVSPAKHILKTGDYITAVNGEPVSEKEELVEAVEASLGEPVTLTVQRDGAEISCEVTPVDSGDGAYRIGVWVRDDMAGIGTLTYVESDGSFGALGHGISDTDTASTVEMSEGTAYLAEIVSIIKGEKGNPGELVGQISYQDSNIIGAIEDNNVNGIYGTLTSLPDELSDAQAVTVGYKQEVVCGTAQILLELDGEFDYYDIEIESTDMNPSETNKSIRFRVTDEDLIAKTGGIIQGLSGAPILQNGKIIGAVTHVFVSDPLEGYGIFIEDMMEEY